jgi:hypothetical protein
MISALVLLTGLLFIRADGGQPPLDIDEYVRIHTWTTVYIWPLLLSYIVKSSFSISTFNIRCYFGCLKDLLIDWSRGPKARIYTDSHIHIHIRIRIRIQICLHIRLNYLDMSRSPDTDYAYSHTKDQLLTSQQTDLRLQTELRLTMQVLMQHTVLHIRC